MGRMWHLSSSRRARRAALEPLAAIRKLMNWNPFLDRDVARLARTAEPVFSPTFDILETEEYCAFLVDLPGVRRADLDITWSMAQLTITGVRRAESWGEAADYYALERTFGGFSRSFNLPAGVCADQTRATLKDGVLTVLVPKASLPQPGRVPVHEVRPVLDQVEEGA